MPIDDYWELYERARSAVSRREFAASRSLYEKALERRSDSFDARYGLANVCLLLKDYRAAITHFESALLQAPRHVGSLVNLGAVRSLLGEHDQAAQHLRRAIQIDGTNPDAYYNLGIAYKNLGQVDLAAEAYQQAHRLSPKLIDPIINLGNIHLEAHRPDKAEECYRKVLALNPNEQKALDGVRAVEKLRAKVKAADPNSAHLPAVEDPIENDLRYDRAFDPESDSWTLTRLHDRSGKSVESAETWLRGTRELDTSILAVSKCLATSAPKEEMGEALSQLHALAAGFHAAMEDVAGRLAAIREIQHALAEGQTTSRPLERAADNPAEPPTVMNEESKLSLEARVRRLEKEITSLRDLVQQLHDAFRAR